jgi:hypothetical protein
MLRRRRRIGEKGTDLFSPHFFAVCADSVRSARSSGFPGERV